MVKFKILAVDVDGTLTDGSVYYDNTGNEFKKFSVKDGVGIAAARACGIKIMVITGRKCPATKRRMNELGIDYIFQGVKNKKDFLQEFMIKNGIEKNEIGYIGDDINDLCAMLLTGFIGCPYDACEEVKKAADYISDVKGGSGAVRDVICYILKKEYLWENTILNLYGTAGGEK